MNTSLFRHVSTLIQAIRNAVASFVETITFAAPQPVRVEPYMESLPTRRPLPRRSQAHRFLA